MKRFCIVPKILAWVKEYQLDLYFLCSRIWDGMGLTSGCGCRELCILIVEFPSSRAAQSELGKAFGQHHQY